MPDENPASSLRINKYIAFHIGVSRREADDLVSNGHVTIDGQPAVTGQRVTDENSVKIKGKPVSSKTEARYVMFNKPVGYVCSRKAQPQAPTIYSILPKQFHSLKTVGRLDKDSSGLILLTNDGDFAYQMTHPRFSSQKTYYVRLDAALAPLHQQLINDYHVQIDNRPSKLFVEQAAKSERRYWKIIMREGRNRQIRRTFEALGYTVVDLHRITFGRYELGGLASGSYQEVTKL